MESAAIVVDLRQRQEQFGAGDRLSCGLFQEKTALARQHETLIAQHETLFAVHQAAKEQLHAVADLLGLAPEHVTDEGASLVSMISALLERESLVRSVLGAPTRATDIRLAASDSQGTPFGCGVPFHSGWKLAVANLGDLHLQAADTAQALTKARELEVEVGVLENTPLLRDKFVVAVAGGFSSGKSSFITASSRTGPWNCPPASGRSPPSTYVMTGAGDAIRGHTCRGGQIAITGLLYTKPCPMISSSH